MQRKERHITIDHFDGLEQAIAISQTAVAGANNSVVGRE
jgi:hypothetical protein